MSYWHNWKDPIGDKIEWMVELSSSTSYAHDSFPLALKMKLNENHTKWFINAVDFTIYDYFYQYFYRNFPLWIIYIDICALDKNLHEK